MQYLNQMEKNIYNNFTNFLDYNKNKSNNNEKQDNNSRKDTSRQSWNEYMASKREKLMKQFNEEVVKYNNNNEIENNKTLNPCKNLPQELSQLFSGVCIYVNGYTKPSALILKQLMAQYGGIYLNHFDGTRTTHTIATNLPFSKTKVLKGNEKIVKPEWIVDSIKHNKLLPIFDYLLIKTGGHIERFFHKSGPIKHEIGLNCPKINNNSTNQIEILVQNEKLQIEGQLVQNISELFDNEIHLNTIHNNCSESRIDESNIQINDKTIHDNNDKTDENIISKLNTRKTTTFEKVLTTDESANKTDFKESNYIPNSMSQIDEEFLLTLPFNLRQDILSTINCNNLVNKKAINISNVMRNTEKTVNKKKNSSLKSKKKLKTSPQKMIIKSKNSGNEHVKSGPLDTIFKDLKTKKRRGLLSSNLSANICGKTHTKDVIDLITEWIETEEDMIDEDIAYVTKYFCDLIDERNYDRLKVIAIALYNSVEQRNQIIWKETYNDIRNTIISELKAINNQMMAQIDRDLPSF